MNPPPVRRQFGPMSIEPSQEPWDNSRQDSGDTRSALSTKITPHDGIGFAVQRGDFRSSARPNRSLSVALLEPGSAKAVRAAALWPAASAGDALLGASVGGYARCGRCVGSMTHAK